MKLYKTPMRVLLYVWATLPFAYSFWLFWKHVSMVELTGQKQELVKNIANLNERKISLLANVDDLEKTHNEWKREKLLLKQKEDTLLNREKAVSMREAEVADADEKMKNAECKMSYCISNAEVAMTWAKAAEKQANDAEMRAKDAAERAKIIKDEIEAQTRSNTDTICHLSKEIETLKLHCKELVVQTNQMSIAVIQINAELDAARKRKKDAEEQHESLKQEINRLLTIKEDYEGLSAQTNVLSKKIGELREKVKNLEKSKRTLTNTIVSMQEKQQTLISQMVDTATNFSAQVRSSETAGRKDVEK